MTDCPIKDLLAFPDASLHTTRDVADFFGLSAYAIRKIARRGSLKIWTWQGRGLMFRTADIRDYLEKARLFKSKKGLPILLKEETNRPEGQGDAHGRQH